MTKWNAKKKNKENNNNSKENASNSYKGKIADGKWCKTTTTNLKVASKIMSADKIWAQNERLIATASPTTPSI